MGKFASEQLDKNVSRISQLQILATQKGLTVAQLAIAWVVAKWVVLIPGTKKIKYIEENIAVAPDELKW